MRPLLTIVQPHHSDGLTSTQNPVQREVLPFVHAAVLQRLYERGRLSVFARRKVKLFWRREGWGDEVRTQTAI